MALPYQGGARYPGPTGLSGRTMGWEIPGVLGFKQVDLSKGQVATKAAKSVGMPPPWKNSDSKRVGRIPWKLAASSVAPDDVKQGGMANCPVAAILAALANTTVGQKYLDKMITEYTGVPIKTHLSDEVLKDMNETTTDPDDKQQLPEIVSNRYFNVSFWNGDIPDTFYIKYNDNPDYIEPIFMGSPNEVLWPAVVEKACAYSYGSYRELGNYHKHTANEHWKLLVGKEPKGFEVKSDDATLDKIKDAARGAKETPTIGASKPGVSKVTQLHGFAILGLSASKVEMYNPYGQKVSLSPEEFRDNFQTVLFGVP